MKETTKFWLRSASDDLHVISKITSDPTLTNMVAFHAQQCIEKSLKAFIEDKGLELPKIHDLIRLFNIASLEIQDNWKQKIIILNDLYTQARYPGEIGLLPDGKPDLKQAKDFAKTANEIYNAILKLTQV